MTDDDDDQHIYILDEVYGYLPASIAYLSDNGKEGVARIEIPEDTWANTTCLSINRRNQTTCVTTGEEVETYVDDYPNRKFPLQNSNVATELWNLRDLKHMNEAAVLFALKDRYGKNMVYTRSGASTLIALNPFRFVSSLYEDHILAKYTPTSMAFKRIQKEGNIKLMPHVVEVSALAYKALMETKKDQSIIASGISGSGKSEALRYALYHLVGMCARNDEDQPPYPDYDDSGGSITPDSELPVPIFIAASDPLFEAFGHCSNQWNDNSSRFAKLTELYFDPNSSRLIGSSFRTYLLDSSALVNKSKNTPFRSFHIFYALLAAPADFRQSLWPGAEHLTASCFRYLGHTDVMEIENQTDEERFYTVFDALETFGINDREKNCIWMALCIVLQLGNIVIGKENSCDDSIRSFSTSAMDDVEILGELMGVSAKEIDEAMTVRTYNVSGHKRQVKLIKGEIMEHRDLFAKTIYSITFDWIVNRMNDFANPPRNTKSISLFLLDYFGFEDMESNRFEQLCINFACEKLQQTFLTGQLQNEVNQYKSQGILAEDFEADIQINDDVIGLFERGPGLKTILIDECKRRSGSDTSFVFKAKAIHKKSNALVQESENFRRSAANSTMFKIRHSVSECTYDSTGFISSNKSKLSDEWIGIGRRCNNKIISSGFARIAADIMAGIIKENEFVSEFSLDIEELMLNLKQTQIRHIICIRPNDLRAPGMIEQSSVLAQLRAKGVPQSLCIEREIGSFEAEFTFNDFLSKYWYLLPDDEPSLARPEQQVRFLLSQTIVDSKNFSCGQSKVYVTQNALKTLDDQLKGKLEYSALIIQSFSRGAPIRLLFVKKRSAAVCIEAYWRGYRSRRDFSEIQYRLSLIREEEHRQLLIDRQREDATTKIQSWWRSYKEQINLRSRKRAVATIHRLYLRWQRKRNKNIQSFDDIVFSAKLDNDVNTLLAHLTSADNGSNPLLQECERTLELMVTCMRHLNFKNSQLRNNFQNNHDKNVQLRKQDSLKSEKTRAIELERSRLAQQNQELRNRLNIVTDELSTLKEKMVLKDASALQSTTKLNNNMRNEILKREKTITQLTQQLSDTKNLHESEVKRLKYKAENENVSYSEEIKILKQELMHAKEAHSLEISQLFNTLEKVEHDRDDIQGKQDDYEQELLQMKNELDAVNQDHQSELSRTQKDFLTYQNKSEAEKNELKRRLRSSNDELERCKSDLKNNSSEDVMFLRGAVNKAHGEIRKVKLEMDALKALHEREKEKMKEEAKKATAPCRRCMWQTNMQKAKALQRNKAIEQINKRGSSLQKSKGMKRSDSKRSPYDSDSD